MYIAILEVRDQLLVLLVSPILQYSGSIVRLGSPSTYNVPMVKEMRHIRYLHPYDGIALVTINILAKLIVVCDAVIYRGSCRWVFVPLLLAGSRKNTNLFRFYFTDCTPSSVPPTPEDTARYDLRSHQHLKTQPDMMAAGCRN
jgi:hypothetical protein